MYLSTFFILCCFLAVPGLCVSNDTALHLSTAEGKYCILNLCTQVSFENLDSVFIMLYIVAKHGRIIPTLSKAL